MNPTRSADRRVVERRSRVCGALLASSLAAAARAQCTPAWQDVGGVWGGPAAPTYAFGRSLAGSHGAFFHTPLGALFLGDSFLQAGPVPARATAARDARSWRALGTGTAPQTSTIQGLRFIDGRGASGVAPGAYYCGTFESVGGVRAHHLARWDGTTWHDAQWEWAYRRIVLTHRSAGERVARLYAGGYGYVPFGNVPYAIARWENGSWIPFAHDLAGFFPGDSVKIDDAVEFDDDGPGPRDAGLYVGGGFYYAGGMVVRNIARWNGTGWESLGSGMNGSVMSLCVFDPDGPGPLRERLYAGGSFSNAGGVSTGGIAQWDGQAWSAVPGWNASTGVALAVFDDDGPGPNKTALFIGGLFINAGGTYASRIIKWDGENWYPLVGPTGEVGLSGWGQNTQVMSLAVFDEDGPGPNPGGLYVGGFFTHAGGIPANSIARWGCPMPAQCYANCSLDFDPVTGAHVLSIADFACFQTRFVLQDPYADCDADGSLTIADFGCFQTKFVQGCP